MRFVASHSHNNGVTVWQNKELYEWITNIFNAPSIEVGPRSTLNIRQHTKLELEKEGWAFNVRVDAAVELTVFSRRGELVIQLQTGNISRYAYDIIKIQHLYTKNEIEAAALAIPIKDAAKLMGSNIANAERIWNELQVFKRVITAPIMIVAFE